MIFGIMTRKDKKEMERKIEALYNMLISLSRIQQIHPTVIRRKMQQYKENIEFMNRIKGVNNEKK